MADVLAVTAPATPIVYAVGSGTTVGLPTFDIGTSGLSTTGGSLSYNATDGIILNPLASGAAAPAGSASLPNSSMVKFTSGAGENLTNIYGRTDDSGKLIQGSLTTDKTAAADLFFKSQPKEVLNDALQMDAAAQFAEKEFDVKADRGLELMKNIADVRTRNANAGYAEQATEQLAWSITRDKYQLGMQVGGMLVALWDKWLQSEYQDHRIGLEDKMMTLAETKETNKYDLQKTLMEKESTLKDSAMKYDYKTAKLNAGTEKYKAKLAADVKKSKIKQDSIRDLFFRNQYPYGNNAYA